MTTRAARPRTSRASPWWTFIIGSGAVKLSAPSRDGRESVAATLGAGEMIGEPFESGRLHDARAVEESRLVALSSAEVLARLGHPAVAAGLVAM